MGKWFQESEPSQRLPRAHRFLPQSSYIFIILARLQGTSAEERPECLTNFLIVSVTEFLSGNREAKIEHGSIPTTTVLCASDVRIVSNNCKSVSK